MAKDEQCTRDRLLSKLMDALPEASRLGILESMPLVGYQARALIDAALVVISSELDDLHARVKILEQRVTE